MLDTENYKIIENLYQNKTDYKLNYNMITNTN